MLEYLLSLVAIAASIFIIAYIAARRKNRDKH